MPMKFKKYTLSKKKKTGPRRPRGGRRMGPSGVPEQASMTVKFTAQNGDSTIFSQNTLYRNTSVALTDLGPRAAAVAAAYAEFSIKRITCTWKPLADSFLATAGSAGDAPINTSKPHLYYQLDKAGSVPANISLEGLKAMGSRPRALDEKPVSVSWRPTVLLADVAASASQVKTSPFLPTARQGVINTTSHKGIYWYMEQAVFRQGLGYTAEFTVELVFRKPYVANMIADVAAIDVIPAVADTSSNGIVDDIA